jgi:hypothetical protein
VKDYALTIDTAKYRCCKEQKRKKSRQEGILLNVKKQTKNTLGVIKSEMALLIENEALKLDNERMKPRSNLDMVFNTTSLIDMEKRKILNLPYGRNLFSFTTRERNLLRVKTSRCNNTSQRDISK